MSQTTISFALMKIGVLYDATSVTFQSPPGVSPAIGLIRTDNSQSVIPPGTPFIHDSTGLYHYTFDDPTPGLQYNFWRQVVVDGETLFDNASESANVPTPTSPYWTWTQFTNRFGLKNIASCSNKDVKSDIPNYVAIQDSFDYAVDEIHTIQRGGVLATPLDFSAYNMVQPGVQPLPPSPAIPPCVSRWGMIIAYADLYDVRGWEDKNIVGNRMRKLLAQTYDDMALVSSGVKQILAAPAKDYHGCTVDQGIRPTFGPPSLFGFGGGLGWIGRGWASGLGYAIPGLGFGWGYNWIVPDGCLTFFGSWWYGA